MHFIPFSTRFSNLIQICVCSILNNPFSILFSTDDVKWSWLLLIMFCEEKNNNWGARERLITERFLEALRVVRGGSWVSQDIWGKYRKEACRMLHLFEACSISTLSSQAKSCSIYRKSISILRHTFPRNMIGNNNAEWNFMTPPTYLIHATTFEYTDTIR